MIRQLVIREIIRPTPCFNTVTMVNFEFHGCLLELTNWLRVEGVIRETEGNNGRLKRSRRIVLGQIYKLKTTRISYIHPLSLQLGIY